VTARTKCKDDMLCRLQLSITDQLTALITTVITDEL
jgi:hypothetical protein